MGKHETKEQQRQYVEHLLATDLSVPEWCKRNRIPKQTMYHWLNTFAEREPELFGGVKNISDRTKRRWVETTRENIRKSKMLATREASCGVVIVDTLFAETAPDATTGNQPAHNVICVELGGAVISIPPGSEASDIAAVLRVVAAL
jgi:predicted DNA-binding protein YlxM (UPF0122 family)